MGKTKHRHIRFPLLRALAKWGGLLICVMIAALWVFSAYYGIKWTHFRQSLVEQFSILAGCFLYSNSPLASSSVAADGWSFSAVGEPRRVLHWLPGLGLNSFSLPLWIPLVMMAIPTASLFILDRRQRSHKHCCHSCRYNLRGLPPTTSKCPECGTVRSAAQVRTASSPATPPAERAPERTP